jgi:hypothetical protein
VINWEQFMSIPREAGLSQEARDLIFSLCTRCVFYNSYISCSYVSCSYISYIS